MRGTSLGQQDLRLPLFPASASTAASNSFPLGVFRAPSGAPEEEAPFKAAGRFLTTMATAGKGLSLNQRAVLELCIRLKDLI